MNLLFVFCLRLSPILTDAKALASINTQEPLAAPYLKDLEELGYCVIPHVLSTSEAEALYQRVWHEYIENVAKLQNGQLERNISEA